MGETPIHERGPSGLSPREGVAAHQLVGGVKAHQGYDG
jgi:hypothetical protein